MGEVVLGVLAVLGVLVVLCALLLGWLMGIDRARRWAARRGDRR